MNIDLILKDIDLLKNRLDGFRPLSDNQTSNLKRLFDIDFTYNSTAIEGNTYTLQETRIVLLDGITVGGKSTREHLEIINHKEAIDFIERLSRKHPALFTKTDILNIHAIVLKGIDPENAGKYREVPVYVRLKTNEIHKFCDPIKLPDEMEAFFLWLQKNAAHPVLQAAEAHARFVSIHPFVDGNGRTARLLMNLMLLHSGYPPAIIKVSKRTEYMDALEAWQQKRSEEPFFSLVFDAVKESLELYLDTLQNNIIWK